MNENLNPINELPPFLNFCYTVGMLPTSYKISLTYEEQVLEAIRYIKEEIIPTVNSNALATKELQEKFVELVNYVDNYFENLDVDEEINQKLDEMAQNGTLTTLLSVYANETFNPTLENLNDKIDENNDNIQEQINSINSRISNVYNMQPKVVNSVSDMTNTSEIYILTTDGYWYYYDNNQWNRGALYQARGINDYSVFPNNLSVCNNALLLSSTMIENNYVLSPSYNTALLPQSLGNINPISRYKIIFIDISCNCDGVGDIDNFGTYLRINEINSEDTIVNRTNINFDYTKKNNIIPYIVTNANTTKLSFNLGVNFTVSEATTTNYQVTNFTVKYESKYILDSKIFKTSYENQLRGCENLPYYFDIKNRINFKLGSIVYGEYYPNNIKRFVSDGYYTPNPIIVNADFAHSRVAFIKYTDSNYTPQTSIDSGWKTSQFTIPANTYFKLQVSTGDTNANEIELKDVYDNDTYKNLSLIDSSCVLNPQNLSSNYDRKIPNILIPRKVRYIGHRGALYQAPENSKPSFESAGQNANIWGIETDIYFSSDHKMFCIHDSNLATTTTGTGNINEKTASEIEALTINYGAHLDQYPNEKVPYFSEFLDICYKYGKIPIIELKDTNNINYTNLIVDEIKKYGFEESCIIISFSENLINKVREYTKKIHCQLLIPINTDVTTNINTYINKINAIENCGISIEYTDNYSKNDVELIHSNYGSFGIWTLEGIDTTYNSNNIDTVTTNV